MDDFSKVKTIIDNSKSIIIVGSKEDSNQDALGAILGTLLGLKNKKNIFVPKDKNSEKIVNFLKETSERKKFVISFSNDVSEVFYEKKDNGLDLYLVPKNIEDADPKNFSCKIVSDKEQTFLSSPSAFDAVIAFNINSFQDLENYFEEDIDSIYQCAVINIGNKPENESYGEVNFIDEKSSLSEKAALLLEATCFEINKKAASFLLWGIVSSLNSFKTPRTLGIIKKLVQKGGRFYSSHSGEETKRKFTLLEKTIKNLCFSPQNNLYFSFLSANDIKSNGSSSSDLSFVVKKMKDILLLPSFVLLWESNSSPLNIKGVFYSDQKEIIDKIKNAYQGNYKNQGGIFLAQKQDLDSAKKEFIALFK